MSAELSAPVAVVTGAARGIGAASAVRLASAGWRLVLVDRCADDPALGYPLATPAELDAVVQRCGGEGCAVGLVGDVRDQDALDAAVAEAIQRFGGLDAAVAVAGAIAGAPAWETDDETWAAMLGTNLEGVWRLARASVPALLARPEPRSGRFVAVASAAGAVGLSQLGAYCAAKHGVVGLVRAMAAELAAAGVTVNAIAPGSTDTATLAASAAVYGIEPAELARHQPLGRLLRPEEVAAVVAFVCSAEASGVTGAVLPVDGGMTAS